MRWIALLTFALPVLAGTFDEIVPSTPDEIASLNADLLVDGFVSVASGQLSLAQTDLHVKGAQDIHLRRTYLPPRILGSYDDEEKIDRFYLGQALYQLYAKGWVTLPHLYAGYNLNSPYFKVRDSRGTVLEFQIEGNRGHLKNSEYGCSNLRGGEPVAEADIRNVELWKEDKQFKLIWPNGTTAFYKLHAPGKYHLDYELLSNGKAIRYYYDGYWNLKQISSTDASGQYIYASIEQIRDRSYSGSDGRKAELINEIHEINGKLKRDGHKEKQAYQFSVLTKALNPYYSNSIGYNDRLLLTSYDAKEYPISCTYYQLKESLCRVQSFSTPSGTTTFAYDLPTAGEKGGSTTVTHPNGSQTIYRFNSNFLLSAIENWFDGKLYNQKIFSYNSKQHVAKIETKDGQDHLLLAKSYACDSAGNPLLEIWEGDFGHFSIQRVFSKNRLVKEEYSDGLGFEYTYLEDTHLITSKTTFSEGKPIRKTEYSYDEACNLIEEKEVGKTIITYHLYKEGPNLHRPEWKIEKDWDGKLIHKTHFTYDQFGNLAEKAHYGSDDCLAYQTKRLYDSHNYLMEETNPIGQKASYAYDARGRQIREIPFSKNREIQRTFDSKGRLISLQEGDHTTCFGYNASDELIQKTDYLGLKTYYCYHPVHGKPVSIEEDPTHWEFSYDDFGRETTRKDVYGATTSTQSNSYGDPLTISYPDGGKELFSYAPNRTLLSATDPDGVVISYTYDPLKRILSKTIGTRTTTYTYDAYHLIEEKDPLGFSTQYQYNLAGQKTQEIREGRAVQFSYDSFGFLSKKKNGSRYTSYQNDVLGRVLAKSVDGCLDTSYTYDPAGNIASITRQDTTQFIYDPYDRLVKKIEADGAITTIAYEEGDKLFTKNIQDPKGIQRIEVYNAHNLPLKKEVPGCILEEYAYDKALRLVSQDHLTFTYTPEGFRSSLTEAGQRTTRWTYTPAGRIRTKIKPDGTHIQYEYTVEGDLARVGSRDFQYDALGRLTGGTGFSRKYDPFGNILREDLATGLILRTSYDHSDRPTERILPDQSRILYTYEGPFLLKISRLNPDGTPLYIHTYDQFDKAGHVLSETGAFTSTYQYDQVGRRTSQTSPYFTEDFVYDPSGNLIRKGSHAYTYDAADQLILSEGEFALCYDQHFNRKAKNSDRFTLDSLNQIEDLPYDVNGNLAQLGFFFDEFDQLTQANGETIFYDALGRRIQKGAISFLYFGEEEVGVYKKGKAEELKIPGLFAPIALEIENKPYFPITDVQGTIRLLIDPTTAKICQKNTCDPFGVGITSDIPYAYVGKRYDAQAGLLYFGKRYYLPALGRWLTPDPLGPIDHSNLYQYLFNNPYRFQDPTGESIGGYLLGLGEIALGGTLLITGGVIEIATVGCYTIGFGFQLSAALALLGDGLVRTTYESRDMKLPDISWKNTNGYTSDRPLPITENGEPKAETDAPHTALGTKEGRKGKYPQAREFDGKGKAVRDIDFTDHGRPKEHSNPHQHKYSPNPTGGTARRGDAEPLENWED